MPPTRLQRSAASLDELRAAVRAEFGPGARIVSAERVSGARLGGLLRRRHVEATIEVPDPSDPPTARVAIAPRRAGILALLEDAEDAEDAMADTPRPGSRRARREAERAQPEVATRSEAFASLMDDLTFNGLAPGAAPSATASVAPEATDGGRALPAGPTTSLQADGDETDARAAFEALASARPGGAVPVGPHVPVPAVRVADGDLVALVGRAADVASVAEAFAEAHGLVHMVVADRRDGILARAAGVRESHAVLASVPWAGDGAALAGIGPDQTWVVVDAGRKHDDAVRMLAGVAESVPLAGIVVIGEGDTASPETVASIGLPVRRVGGV